jgi:hypothetical protein
MYNFPSILHLQKNQFTKEVTVEKDDYDINFSVIQLQWVKHQEVGRLKEWQLVLVTTEIVQFNVSL